MAQRSPEAEKTWDRGVYKIPDPTGWTSHTIYVIVLSSGDAIVQRMLNELATPLMDEIAREILDRMDPPPIQAGRPRLSLL